MTRAIFAFATGATAFAWSAPALSADAPSSKVICQNNYVGGQEARRAGQLRSAAAQFRGCLAESCASFVRDDCGKWAEELADEIPTIVGAARDSSGADVADAQLLVDGEPRARRLDGAPIEVDPGEHTLRFVRGSSPPIDLHVVLRSGEKNRVIAVVFGASVSSTPPSSERETHTRGVPATALIFGGVAITAFGVAAATGISGIVKYNDLSSSCGTSCSDDRVSSVRTQFVVTDIALGVGVASAIVATIFFLTRSTSASVSAASLRPTPSGVIGTF